MRYFRYEGPEGLHAKLNIVNNIVDTLIAVEKLELGRESLLLYLEGLAGVKRPITRFEGLAASRILDTSDSWIHTIEGTHCTRRCSGCSASCSWSPTVPLSS